VAQRGRCRALHCMDVKSVSNNCHRYM